jgi:hypothetical protein
MLKHGQQAVDKGAAYYEQDTDSKSGSSETRQLGLRPHQLT